IAHLAVEYLYPTAIPSSIPWIDSFNGLLGEGAFTFGARDREGLTRPDPGTINPHTQVGFWLKNLTKEKLMALHIGSIAPDFTQESTEGSIKFHEWAGKSWV